MQTIMRKLNHFELGTLLTSVLAFASIVALLVCLGASPGRAALLAGVGVPIFGLMAGYTSLGGLSRKWALFLFLVCLIGMLGCVLMGVGFLLMWTLDGPIGGYPLLAGFATTFGAFFLAWVACLVVECSRWSSALLTRRSQASRDSTRP